jgi:hypothetical protein
MWADDRLEFFMGTQAYFLVNGTNLLADIATPQRIAKLTPKL